jgi:AcrR family transcriptional regulator
MQLCCNIAVRLQFMAARVKPGRQAARVERTEERILAAARVLFVRHGYAGTTLTAVAERAGIAPRTVYVRFGSKAALLKRVIDVAIAGDTEPVAVTDRDWYRTALSAPTLAERIEAHATGAAELHERAGAVIAVAREAEAAVPLLAKAAQAGREATRDNLRRFWAQARADGLLGRSVDLDWLADTAGLLAHAETYLLMRKTLGWSAGQWRDWMRTTWLRLATAAGT